MKTNNCINRILEKTLSRGFPLYETWKSLHYIVLCTAILHLLPLIQSPLYCISSSNLITYMNACTHTQMHFFLHYLLYHSFHQVYLQSSPYWCTYYSQHSSSNRIKPLSPLQLIFDWDTPVTLQHVNAICEWVKIHVTCCIHFQWGLQV